jgi:hypothetical protein
MVSISEFSLEKHSGPYGFWPLRTKLLRDGVYTGVRLPGFIIDRQYRTRNGGYFFIANSDCPFEESQHFILLDSNLRVRSYRHLMAPYDTWLLESCEVKDDDSLLLGFRGEPTLHILVRLRESRYWFLSWIMLKRLHLPQRFDRRS